jgi:peptidoglycan/LPS O-acetylase OafA/YrhL
MRRSSSDRPDVSESPSASGAVGRDAFRPDIEGLRALAVLLVLAYHAHLPFFGGGFIGVDVFFVLSGFLITGLIVREVQQTGTISLPTFYARRARRLLPAALLVIAVTVLVSFVVLPRLLVPDVALDGAASALYVGNIRFALQATDYLQAEFAPSPLLHYWSLGVEEQFYLFWPALILVAVRLGGSGRRWIGGVVAAVGVASLAASLLLTGSNAPLAFFLLPTRAWELALGALVFLAAARLAALPTGLATALGIGGVGLIAGGAAVIDTTTQYPGFAALVPTVGAAMVIAAGMGRAATLPSRLLASAPARWVGRISYSLYLWHWPILVLPVAALGQELPIAARLALALAAIPIAALSQRFVEAPIRRVRLTGPRTNRTLAIAGAASLLVAVTTAGLGRAATIPGETADGSDPTPALVLPSRQPGPSGPAGSSGPVASSIPTRPPTIGGPVPTDLIPPLAKARSDIAAIYHDGCHAAATDVKPQECTYGDAGSPTTVVLFGDSHAAQWFPAFERLAGERHWRLISLTKGACPAADVPIWSETLKRPYAECDEWRVAALKRIAAARPALVVVSNSRNVLLIDDAGKAIASRTHDDVWSPGLARMLGRLRALAPNVVLIGDTPNPKNDPPVCLSAHLDDSVACATAATEAIGIERLAVEASVAAMQGTGFIDPTDWVCPSDPCPVVIDRWLVYRDGGHIATAFSRALAPYLEEQLPAIP